MIIVHTNVFSEAIRPRLSDAVASWWKSQQSLYTTAITVAEAFEGIERLPFGSRRMQLEFLTEQLFEDQFAGQVLPFDEDAARAYAEVFGCRQRDGRPTTQTDAMIRRNCTIAGNDRCYTKHKRF